MSKQTPPNPFGEKTVVQVRNPSAAPAPTPETTSETGAGEKTVVHARSNLKATFDERTVVRPSSSLPADMPPLPKAEAPKIPDAPKAEAIKVEAPKVEAPKIPEAPKVEAQVTQQPAPKQEPSFTSFTPSSHTTEPQSGGAVQIKTAEAEEPVKKPKKEKAPREPRQPLDQRTKLMIAGGAAVAILAVVFMMAGGDATSEAPKTPQQNAQTQGAGEQSMASQEPSETGAPKIQQLSGPPATTTTDVLNRFDRAALRAQERAEQYSRSGGGF